MFFYKIKKVVCFSIPPVVSYLRINYINSSGHSGSSITNQDVNNDVDVVVAVLLNKFAKNSIFLPPFYLFCLNNLYKNNLNRSNLFMIIFIIIKLSVCYFVC